MKLKDPEIGQAVFVKEDIIEHANECHPAYRLARRGDVVIVKDKSFVENGWLVAHPSVSDNAFRLDRSEFMLEDNLITIAEQKEYLRITKLKSLEERYNA